MERDSDFRCVGHRYLSQNTFLGDIHSAHRGKWRIRKLWSNSGTTEKGKHNSKVKPCFAPRLPVCTLRWCNLSGHWPPFHSSLPSTWGISGSGTHLQQSTIEVHLFCLLFCSPFFLSINYFYGMITLYRSDFQTRTWQNSGSSVRTQARHCPRDVVSIWDRKGCAL